MLEFEVMPKYSNIKRIKTLWDKTRIFYCYDETNQKHMLIIDNKYDTVIRIPFDDESFVNIVKRIKISNHLFFIMTLINIYPDIKAWQHHSLHSEIGDTYLIVYKNKQIIFTNNFVWKLDQNFIYFFEVNGEKHYNTETHIIQKIIPADALEIGMRFLFRRLEKDKIRCESYKPK